MANFVTNIITFKGDESKIKELLERVKNDNVGIGSIDFEKVIPMPDNIYRGDLGLEERNMYRHNNWYDWSCNNWGTKWNACGYGDPDKLRSDRLWFNTPRSPPIPVTAELAKQFPDIEITHRYADEDFGTNVGTVVFKYGETPKVITPKAFTYAAYKMAIEILDLTDTDLKNMGYVYDESIGNYKYVECDDE